MSDKEQEMRIEVTCRPGQHGDEEPAVFSIGAREVGVGEVLDRWLDPDHRYFKVRGADGGIYILRYDLELNRWAMALYDSGQRDETRLSSS